MIEMTNKKDLEDYPQLQIKMAKIAEHPVCFTVFVFL